MCWLALLQAIQGARQRADAARRKQGAQGGADGHEGFVTP